MSTSLDTNQEELAVSQELNGVQNTESATYISISRLGYVTAYINGGGLRSFVRFKCSSVGRFGLPSSLVVMLLAKSLFQCTLSYMLYHSNRCSLAVDGPARQILHIKCTAFHGHCVLEVWRQSVGGSGYPIYEVVAVRSEGVDLWSWCPSLYASRPAECLVNR